MFQFYGGLGGLGYGIANVGYAGTGYTTGYAPIATG